MQEGLCFLLHAHVLTWEKPSKTRNKLELSLALGDFVRSIVGTHRLSLPRYWSQKKCFISASIPVGKLAFAIETSPTHTFVKACVPAERGCIWFYASAANFKWLEKFYSFFYLQPLSMVLNPFLLTFPDKQIDIVKLLHEDAQMQLFGFCFFCFLCIATKKYLYLCICVCLCPTWEMKSWRETCSPVSQVRVQDAALLCCMPMRACLYIKQCASSLLLIEKPILGWRWP